MNKSLLLGLWRCLLPIPRPIWQGQVNKDVRESPEKLKFMSDEHHRVRDFVVVELPRVAAPLAPAYIAQELELPLDRVQVILDELEKHMTFLFRNEQGQVTWAYPVTADETPHCITFSTGEQINAA